MSHGSGRLVTAALWRLHSTALRGADPTTRRASRLPPPPRQPLMVSTLALYKTSTCGARVCEELDLAGGLAQR